MARRKGKPDPWLDTRLEIYQTLKLSEKLDEIARLQREAAWNALSPTERQVIRQQQVAEAAAQQAARQQTIQRAAEARADKAAWRASLSPQQLAGLHRWRWIALAVLLYPVAMGGFIAAVTHHPARLGWAVASASTLCLLAVRIGYATWCRHLTYNMTPAENRRQVGKRRWRWITAAVVVSPALLPSFILFLTRPTPADRDLTLFFGPLALLCVSQVVYATWCRHSSRTATSVSVEQPPRGAPRKFGTNNAERDVEVEKLKDASATVTHARHHMQTSLWQAAAACAACGHINAGTPQRCRKCGSDLVK